MTNHSYIDEVHQLLPHAKVFKLKGYSNKNQNYDNAKKPPRGYKWKEVPSLNDVEIQEWINQDGWIGAAIPENRIVIDIDEQESGQCLQALIEKENVRCHIIKTPNGLQFVFKAEEMITQSIKQITKYFSSIGVVIDTRTANKGYIVFPTSNTKERYVSKKSHQNLDEVPFYLRPIRNSKTVIVKETNEKYQFPLPIKDAGSRNDMLYHFASYLRAWKVPNREIMYSMELIYEYFLSDKTEFTLKELETLTHSAIKWEPDFSTEEIDLYSSEEKKVPLPFRQVHNSLYKTITKMVFGREVEEEKRISRMIPYILRKFSNVEKNHIYYEIGWTDQGNQKKEVVAASALSTKKDLILLADKGFSVNDLNYKDLIDYFDKYQAVNPLPVSQMVERLGYIKDQFIHPLYSQDVEVIPTDIGDKQLLEGFQTKGTSEKWMTEVWEQIKSYPKVVFMTLASFASILLQDLNIDPFIVDLSGSTSQGKTTALQISRSVWGTGSLINEWNITKNAIERKAGFLNSYPMYLDDSRKADERILQPVIYQFSGGRSKGRSTLTGSQFEMTWQNILISTGEISLADYANKAGGAAARIISLVDEPFEGIESDCFSKLYKAIQANYGAIGLDFLKKWQEQKEKLIPEFHKFEQYYLKKAKGNEVLTRLSRYYAVIHYTGSLLKTLFNLDIYLPFVEEVFTKSAIENGTIDKPKEILEEVLSDLDTSRTSIFYEEEPDYIKAIYRYNTLCLMPAYLKDKLGTEEKLIRKEWLKRGYTLPQTFKLNDEEKTVDYFSIKHEGRTFRVVALNVKVFDELGFNFEIDEKGYKSYKINLVK